MSDTSGHFISTRLELLSKLAPHADAILLERLILSVIEKLSFEYSYIPIKSLKTLAIIAPYANQTQVNTIISAVTNKLDDNDWKIRNAALTALAALVQLADKTQVEFLTLKIIRKIDNDIFWLNSDKFWINGDINELVKTLSAILPFLSELQINTLILKVSNNMEDRPFQPGVKNLDLELTFTVLERLAPCINTSQLDTFIDLVAPKLNTDSELIMRPVLKSLAIIALHINPVTMNTILNLVTVKLDNSLPKYICEEALHTLKKLVPYATSTQIELLTPKIFEKLEDDFRFVPIAALNVLKKFPAPANKAQLDNFIVVVIEKLNAEDNDVRKAALETLAAIVPYADTIQSKILVTTTAVKLDDSDKEIRNTALNMLSAILINNPSIYEDLIEYTKSHPAATTEHHLLKMILDTYTAIYTPEPTPIFNMVK